MNSATPQNPVFTIGDNVYEIAVRGVSYDFAGWARYPGCVTTKRGPHKLAIIVAPSGSMVPDCTKLPRRLAWRVREQLTDDVLNQILYK